MDLINHSLEIPGGEMHLYWTCGSSCLVSIPHAARHDSSVHSIYIVLGIVSHQTDFKYSEDEQRLCTNNTPFCRRDLSVWGFWYLWRCPGFRPLWVVRDGCPYWYLQSGVLGQHVLVTALQVLWVIARQTMKKSVFLRFIFCFLNAVCVEARENPLHHPQVSFTFSGSLISLEFTK